MNKHKFPYKWHLTDGYPAKGIKYHGHSVFGTFVCGGGSTMGYKLAGFHHIGGVEIDKKVAECYRINHNPKYLFNEDIREFNKRGDLPDELYNLDLLDGSPPCSSFSMAGNREKDWGKEKQFAEGQALQTLDDLVFTYCDTIIKLQPKAFLLENVKGIIQGNAKSYSKKIVEKMTKAGYAVQVFLLNAASMGVPQKRERVFFIGNKMRYQKLELAFNEKPIVFGEIIDYQNTKNNLSEYQYHYWQLRKKTDKCFGDIIGREEKGKVSGFTQPIIHSDDVSPVIPATSGSYALYDIPRNMSKYEMCQMLSFPLDYQFLDVEHKFIMGMSVPPVMTAQIAHKIYEQWLKPND